jgi:hypothetical protein
LLLTVCIKINPKNISDKMYGVNCFFNGGDLRDFLQNQKESAIREIKNQDPNYILNVSVADYSKHLVPIRKVPLP